MCLPCKVCSQTPILHKGRKSVSWTVVTHVDLLIILCINAITHLQWQNMPYRNVGNGLQDYANIKWENGQSDSSVSLKAPTHPHRCFHSCLIRPPLSTLCVTDPLHSPVMVCSHYTVTQISPYSSIHFYWSWQIWVWVCVCVYWLCELQSATVETGVKSCLTFAVSMLNCF